jgi:CelD/BcsL family acetyltransferase involved in cellulose biosynthesis
VPFWVSKPSPFAVGEGMTPPYAAPRIVWPSSGERSANGFLVQAFSVERMEEHIDDWRDLTARALEPNAFFEPAFALPAARHFHAKSRPLFVTVWKEMGEGKRKRLMALCPISPTRGFLARAWLHKQAALATPLVDRDNAVSALKELFAWFEQNLQGASGILFPKIPQTGPTYAALMSAARAAGRETRLLESHERAVLLHGESADEAFRRAGGAKMISELRRRRRRLEELGRVEYNRVSSPDEVRVALEEFLTLEASGWKRDRGALLMEPSLATFVRGSMRLLAREGKVQIHRLSLNGRPVAMGIVLESAGRAYFWKIAYDESFRSQAPGLQLSYEVTKTQTARRDIDLTDSCAIADHPMVNRIWPERLVICDLVVQLRPERPRYFANACRTESARREIRALAKRAANRLLGRKSS